MAHQLIRVGFGPNSETQEAVTVCQRDTRLMYRSIFARMTSPTTLYTYIIAKKRNLVK